MGSERVRAHLRHDTWRPRHRHLGRKHLREDVIGRGSRPVEWEISARARQSRPGTCAAGSRGVGMLAKMVLHACIMLATHTYRKVRCGSQLPRVGSLLQRGPIGPSSTCRFGVWTCSTYCIVSREVVANVVTFLTVCGSPSDSEGSPARRGCPGFRDAVPRTGTHPCNR